MEFFYEQIPGRVTCWEVPDTQTPQWGGGYWRQTTLLGSQSPAGRFGASWVAAPTARVGIYSSTLLAHVLAVPQATSLHPDNSKKHIQAQSILFPILIYGMHVFKNHKEQMKCRTSLSCTVRWRQIFTM